MFNYIIYIIKREEKNQKLLGICIINQEYEYIYIYIYVCVCVYILPKRLTSVRM